MACMALLDTDGFDFASHYLNADSVQILQTNETKLLCVLLLNYVHFAMQYVLHYVYELSTSCFYIKQLFVIFIRLNCLSYTRLCTKQRSYNAVYIQTLHSRKNCTRYFVRNCPVLRFQSTCSFNSIPSPPFQTVLARLAT